MRKKITVKIDHTDCEISGQDVRQVGGDSYPERITRYYVEVEGNRFPPKQLIRIVTGRTDYFNSTNARSVLTGLGFSVNAKSE